MVLLLNSVLMPLTYAQEYQDEILGAQVNNTVGDSSNVENANETEGEQNEEAEDASQFPVIEENSQESEITPVDESQDEDQEIPSESTLSWWLEWSENTNQEGANVVGSGNDLDETLWSGDDENLNVQTWSNQIDDILSWAQVPEQLVSSWDLVSDEVWSGGVELEEDSWILSSVVEAIEGIFNSIKYFFVKDNSEYIREYKQNGVKVISLKDPVNGETITIMDRNLWAEDNEITSEDSYGNYYQWWNNNWFEKVDGENATSNLAVYSLKYEWIGYTRDNKFRVWSNDIWELDEEWRSNYDELWYLGEDEEIQWPCPEGYHVPSDKEWNKLLRVWTKIHTVDEKEWWKTVRSVKWDSLKASLEQAWTWDAEENTIEEENLTEVEELFMKELKLPKAGNYATNGEREDWLWIYWSRTPSDKPYQSEVFSLERYFWEDFDENLLNRANWNSVRCFLDTKDKEELVEYNKEEITWEKRYDGVTVSVYAWTWFFPEGTKLEISAIKEVQEINDIKDQVSEENELKEDAKLVAFDISFIYKWEEVQPLEWKVVKVTFDYSNNDELSESDKIDEQEVKVFHIDDKDEEWNKVEKWEEIVKEVTNIEESGEDWVVVADAESFSVYAIVTVTWAPESVVVRYNLNWWYWIEDGSIQSKDVTYLNRNWIYKATEFYRTPSKTWFMFMWWFDNGWMNRRDWVVTDNVDLYAKWQEFWDLDVYILWTDSNKYHYTLMDRNMWATAQLQAWYYYQWWNSFWFIPWSISTTGNTINVSDFSWQIPYYYNLFVAKQSNQDWMEERNMTLRWWNDSILSHKQWPCPEWYHVPTENEWSDAKTYWIKYKSTERANSEFATDFMFKWHWYISRNDWKFSNTSEVRYLTSTLKDQNKWVRVLSSLDWSIQDEWFANWRSLRCFKDEFNEWEINLSDFYLNWWENAIITVISWVVQSIQKPYKNFYDFDWWYTSSDFSWDPIEVWSTLIQWSSLYAKWIANDRYTITYDLNWWFMKYSNNIRESNIEEYAENTNSFTLKNPVKLNSVFLWWSWTNLSSPTLTVTIPKWSKWNRVYEALYECEQGYVFDEDNNCVWVRNADWTLNFDEWEYSTLDFGVWDTKITMLDRNLWATTNDITDNGSRGFYYKWWNNYWFSLDHISKYWATNVKISDVSWYGPWTLSWYYLSPDWIVWWDKDEAWYWFKNVNFDLWWDVTDTLQARQGPCPNEYHIPSDNEVYSVINLLSEFVWTSTWIQCIGLYWNNRKCFQNLLKIPDAGYIKSNSNTNSITEPTRIFLWTSSDYNNKTMAAFHSTQNWNDMTIWERSSAAAMPLRCFKNIDKVKVKYNFNWWYYWDNIYSKPDIEDYWWSLSKAQISPLNLSMKRENSIFSWWYLDSQFKKSFTWGTILPYATQNTTFYARWECNSWYGESQDGNSCIKDLYTVTITSNNENYWTVSSGFVSVQNWVTVTTSGNELTIWNEKIFAAVTWSNAQYTYQFSGWNNTCWETIVSNCSIEAEFTRTLNSYTITFHSNGWSTVDPQTKEYWTIWDKPENPTRDGYDFNGWYSNSGLTIEYHFTEVIEWNVDLYAKWSPITYTITYEYNNGTGSNPETYQIITSEFTLNNPTRIGYTFIWWSGTNLVGSWNKTVTISVWSTWNREYEANWEANKYNVTYKANGWEGEDVKDEAIYDAKYVFTGSKFTRIGYRFVEWNTKSDGTGTWYTEWFSGIWKTTTWVNLYAQWTAETYTVTFDANEWEVVWDNTKEVSYDGEYGELLTATRLWYTFTGWYTEDTVGEKVESETRVSIASDHTLYAHWDENSYNVVYEGWEWTEWIVTWATYRYTEAFNLSANNFTKRGYSFSGWKNGDNHYAAGAELNRLATQNWATVTFTAEWNVVPYSITYKLNGWIFSWVVNPTTYDVNSSTINVGNPEKVWYIFLWWTGTDLSALTTKVVITGWSIWDRTYYANWQARDDIKITINHYLQDLDVNTNTVLDTYSISWTTEEEWTADSIINVSDYQQVIEWYSFDSWKVDGSVVRTTTVSPDWSRVIDLFYTRNSYSYSITTSVWSSTEWSSSNGNYYYWAKIILSWDSNNDCFVWSGWAVQWATLENNMKQTSFIMPANDVTANSLVREKTYNIVFNGNWEDSWTMSPLNWIRCTQEFTLPENSFVKTGYTFTWWTTIPNGVKEFDNKATIQTLTTWDNVTIEFIAIWDVNYYPIVWKDYDWDVLYEDEFPYMENPEYHWETPSRDADEQYTYTFAWWTPEEHVVTWAQVYTAVYNETLNEYTVTWDVNWTKTMETYKYWETPNFTWSKHKDPDEQYEYSFSWWSPEVVSVTGDITYTATYTATLRKFTVTWNNRNGQTLEVDTWVEYWSDPSYNWETPTKPADAGHTYTFNWWTPELTWVTKDTTYVAKFSSYDNKYTITWLDEDDTILEIDLDVPYWEIPSYDKWTPVKTWDAQYLYTFAWWSPEVVPVEGDATYVATYTPHVNTYTITWKNSNWETLREDTWVAYWTTGDFGWIPTSWSTDEFDYEFIWWNPAVWAIHGDTTYTAVYKSNKRKYSVRFVNGETELQSWMVEYGVMPVYIWTTPVKTWDAQYSYNYIWWTPWISAVTWDITYEATFEEIVNMYNVTFVDDDGSSVIQPAQKYAYWTLRGNIAKPVNPDKPDNEQYTYEFAWWIPVVSKITWDVTFTATYSWTLRTYSVTWKNWNGDALETDANVSYWTTPSYDSAEPTKPATAQYRYVFAWWDPVVSPVHGTITYTAQFDEVPMTYTITWKNWNTVLEVDTWVVYWSIPSYDWMTPTKASDPQYDYVFAWWNPSTWEVVSDQVYVADFNPIIRTYTVLWKNHDGTTLETDENVPYWSTPSYNWSTPVKTWNAQYSYTFKDWSPDIWPIHGNIEYTAIYDETINKYVVTWDNYDWTELSSEEVEYWTLPTYTGSTPTRSKTAQYTYIFSNSWLPAVTAVTTGATYTAQFTSTVNEYTITWKDWDWNTLKTEQVAYGGTPEYTWVTPTKTADAQYTYSFNDTWSPAIESVTGDMTYTAQFDSTVNIYPITWKDWDDQVLKTDYVAYGDTPEYTWAIPTKTATQEHTYTFKWWSPAVTSVTGPATYKAVFDGDVNEYAITWLDWDWNILKMETLEYGQMPSYSWSIPTKTADAQYTYTFNGSWSPAIVSVTTGATYTAQFSSTVNKYSIVWKDWDWNTLKTDQVAYGTTPVYAGATPTKTATAQYSYTFNNTWSPEIEDVTTGATYTAQFTPVLNKYTIVWKDWNWTILKPAEELEYGTHPVYWLEDPTREWDAQYSYTFNWWNPAVQDVTGPQVYTATYLQSVNKYRIIFLNDDDSEITSKQVEYWTIVTNYKPADPVKEWYTFNWWNPNLVNVVTWATYKATYTINQYTLTPELWVWLERIEWWWTFDYGTEVVFTWYAKEGYHFEGGETVKVFTVTVWAHNATVRINAIANKYVVRFQPNEWDWTMQDQEFAYDLTWILHANSFRRSWYTFTWWIDEFGNYYADQWKVYNLATWWVVEFTALWKVWEDKPVEPTPAAWWGRIIPKEDKDQEHGSADTQTWWTWDIDSGTQYETWDIIPWDGSWTQEEMDAYKYAYKYHITTLAPREAAMPDDYVIRWHMAKMVVNYAVNVLWWKLPEKLPKQCKWKDWANDWESQEIKDYAEKACALWLMWIDMNYFQPNKYVTRAQFWTIFGRLLRWKLPSTPYYAAHLAWLKERWIMTQIDHPEDRIEIRKWAWLMFMRSEKYFNIKK